MTEKHARKHAAVSPTKKSFDEGYRTGQEWGAIAAPYIVSVVFAFCCYLAWRVLRTIWRWTK